MRAFSLSLVCAIVAASPGPAPVQQTTLEIFEAIVGKPIVIDFPDNIFLGGSGNPCLIDVTVEEAFPPSRNLTFYPGKQCNITAQVVTGKWRGTPDSVGLAVWALEFYDPIAGGDSAFLNATINVGCDAGFYASGEACVPCPPGRYNANPFSTCGKCNPGRAQPAAGSVVCVDCQVGQYVEDEGAQACNPCAVGTFSNQTGSTVCYNCPVATAQNATSASTCTLCTAGKYGNDDGAEQCTLCPTGKFSATEGQVACTDCTVGTYQSGIGKTLCNTCALANTTGASTCPTDPPTEGAMTGAPTEAPTAGSSSNMTSAPSAGAPTPAVASSASLVGASFGLLFVLVAATLA